MHGMIAAGNIDQWHYCRKNSPVECEQSNISTVTSTLTTGSDGWPQLITLCSQTFLTLLLLPYIIQTNSITSSSTLDYSIVNYACLPQRYVAHLIDGASIEHNRIKSA